MFWACVLGVAPGDLFEVLGGRLLSTVGDELSAGHGSMGRRARAELRRRCSRTGKGASEAILTAVGASVRRLPATGAWIGPAERDQRTAGRGQPNLAAAVPGVVSWPCSLRHQLTSELRLRRYRGSGETGADVRGMYRKGKSSQSLRLWTSRGAGSQLNER
jgi:hypothetical protein